MEQQIIIDYKKQLEKNLAFFKDELLKIRTGRVNPKILEDINVKTTSGVALLKQLANIEMIDGKSCYVKPFYPGMLTNLKAGLLNSKLDCSINEKDQNLLIVFSEQTGENKLKFINNCHQIAEHEKIKIRNSRRQALNIVKDMEAKSSKDDINKLKHEIQKITDATIDSLQNMLENKIKVLKS